MDGSGLPSGPLCDRARKADTVYSAANGWARESNHGAASAVAANMRSHRLMGRNLLITSAITQ